MSLSSSSSLHLIGQPEMKGNYSCVQIWVEETFATSSSLFFYAIYLHICGRAKKETLARGHATRDASNARLHMLSASRLARVRETHMYRHALGMAFVGVRLCCPVIIYSGQLYMSIFSPASLRIDELLSTNGIWENGIASAEYSPLLPRSLR